MEALLDQAGEPLVIAIVPFIVAGIRALIPHIPKSLLPIIAGALGPLVDLGVTWTAGLETSGAVAVAYGLAGVGLREVYDQVRKGMSP